MIRPESYRRGAFSSTALQLMAQGLAFVFNLVMAYCFGAVDATDVLNYCITTFTLVASFMLILDSTVLIPEAMRRRHQESAESSMQFMNFFLYVFAGIALTLSLVAAWRPIGFLTSISRFDAAMLEAHRPLILWVIPVFALQLVAQYANSILVSYKYFSLPAMWAVVCRVFNIAFVLLFYRQLGVVALAQSLILGLVLQTLVSFWLMRRHLGWRFTFRLPRIQGAVWRNIAYTEVGLLAFAAASFTPVWMASAVEEGMVTAMNYAVKMATMLQTLIVGQVSLIVGVKLNEAAARRDMAEFEASYERISRLMVWACAPLAFLLCVTAPDIVGLLFLRGAYTQASARITTVLFQGLVLTLPMSVFHALLVQGMAAQQKVLFRNLMQIALSLALAAALWVLVPKIGFLRYPWVKLFYAYGFYLAIAPFVARFVPHIPIWRGFAYLVVNMLVNAALALGCWIVAMQIQHWPMWLRLGATTGLYVAGFAACHRLLPWDRLARDYISQLWSMAFRHWKGRRS